MGEGGGNREPGPIEVTLLLAQGPLLMAWDQSSQNEVIENNKRDYLFPRFFIVDGTLLMIVDISLC